MAYYSAQGPDGWSAHKQALVDKDLKGLSCMVNLRELSLSGANGKVDTIKISGGITGEGLMVLTQLSNLRVSLIQPLDPKRTPM